MDFEGECASRPIAGREEILSRDIRTYLYQDNPGLWAGFASPCLSNCELR